MLVKKPKSIIYVEHWAIGNADELYLQRTLHTSDTHVMMCMASEWAVQTDPLHRAPKSIGPLNQFIIMLL